MCCFFHCVWHLYSIQMRRCSVMINQPCTSSTYIQSVSLKITSTPIFAQHSHTLIFTSLCTWCSHFSIQMWAHTCTVLIWTSPRPALTHHCSCVGRVGGMVVGRGGGWLWSERNHLGRDSCWGHFISGIWQPRGCQYHTRGCMTGRKSLTNYLEDFIPAFNVGKSYTGSI